ncbi:MAG: DUF2851 family protein [Candidatus Brocadiaceae bacterium]
MINLHKHPQDCFSPVYQQMASSFYTDIKDEGASGSLPLQVLEGTEKLIKEELVRCIWFGQHIRKDKLFTDDGSRTEILSPGWWNTQGGPDFKHAEILLEGKGLVKGNIEVHVFASDWMRHQHNKQDTYNSVCLHVVMWNDTHETYIKNADGQLIPQLTLSRYLNAELDEIIDVIDVESYLKGAKVNQGHCQTEIENQRISEQWLGRFLDYAGDERILRKAKRYERWLEQRPFEQALYEAIMESLGYKNNKEPFLMLAALMPLETMRSLIPEDASVQEKKVYLQSLLLGMAGLLPRQQGTKKNYDSETTLYINTMENIWNTLRSKLDQIPMTRDNWVYGGIRPANYPERRIAAIANILVNCAPEGIFHRILCAFQRPVDFKEDMSLIHGIIHTIHSIFLDIHDPYWSYHYTLGGKRLERPMKLLGEERTSTIFINVIISVMFVYARRHNDVHLEKLLHLVYRNYAPLPATSVIKFMSNRMLGQLNASRRIINSVRRQQGLYQLFKDFCENDNVSCNKCALYLAMVKN